ncbi:Grainin 2 [Entamoeba marina]
MSLFEVNTACDSWITQNIKSPYPQNSTVKEQWWYPLCSGVSANEFKEISHWFEQIDKDKSGMITSNELEKTKFKNGIKLNVEVSKRLMKMFDVDESGTVDFYEFVALYKFVLICSDVFEKYDVDGNGSLTQKELLRAIPQLGFNCNELSCNALIKMHGSGLGKPKLNKSQFLSSAAYLCQIRTIYQTMTDGTFNRADFDKLMNLLLVIF